MNARSLKNRLHAFDAEILNGLDFPEVIGITETWLDDKVPNSVLQFGDMYDVFRCDRNGCWGGVMILAKGGLKAKLINSTNFDGLEMITVVCKFNDQAVIFSCYYRNSVSNTEDLPKLAAAVEFLSGKNLPFVLMGDFNLPGINWLGVPTAETGCRQNEFLELFISMGLHQAVNLPTRDTAILDLVFANEPNLINSVDVDPPFCSTCDQNTVVFTFKH